MKELGDIKERLAAATPGPWKTEPVERGRFAHIESRVYSLRGSHILLSPTDGEAGQAKTTDAEFIAAAPADVARLTAAVEAVLSIADSMDRIADFNLGVLPHDDMGISLRQHAEDLRAAVENALKP
jgi:hypothetical protein